jgi:hypothetical protein
MAIIDTVVCTVQIPANFDQFLFVNSGRKPHVEVQDDLLGGLRKRKENKIHNQDTLKAKAILNLEI